MDEQAIYAMLKERKTKPNVDETSEASTKKKKSSTMSEEERRDRIRIGLIRKKECESKALAIVERLVEQNIPNEWFRDAANYITPEYYDDIIEERFCEKLCGYPLCSKALKKVPAQKFKISMKENKVYDITQRKKFCSDLCFKRSNFYGDQIPKSPLWMRDMTDLVRLKFLDESEQSYQLNGKGEEFEFPQLTKRDVERLNEEQKVSLKTENNSKQLKEGKVQACDENSKRDDQDVLNTELKNLDISTTRKNQEEEEIEGEKREISEVSTVENESPKKLKQNFESEYEHSMERIEQVVSEWFTIDTLRFLRGDDLVRTMLEELGITPENIVDICGDEDIESPEIRSKYVELCRSLKLFEIQDEISEQDPDQNPKFRDLKSEVENQSKRVVSFLGLGNEKELKVEEQNVDDYFKFKPVLPLVDRYAQGAQRRRIVKDQMDRVWPDILGLCGNLGREDIKSDFNRLVLTFQFSAENIFFRQDEWNIVAILVLLMLSNVSEKISIRLEDPKSKKFMNLLLLEKKSSLEKVKIFLECLESDVVSLVAKMNYEK